MACATQTFSVTPDQFAVLQEKAKAIGVAFTGTSGQIDAHGVVLDWSYDPTAGALSASCVSKPWIASCGMVNGKIHDLIDQCLQ